MSQQTGNTTEQPDPKDNRDQQEQLSGVDARQGKIVLKSKWQRGLVIGIFVFGIVLLGIVATSIAP
ncbi:MAG TPA: hypothetical protein DCL95_17405 [Rhodospirillaceae bacterium]|jgi:hypothetical protein|nr:hypothetical protein [Rhodospirillaceae bacterium]MAX62618.1 hypothetical protein [Rhodospirillaceae bacterium]MBB57018.1 hypothetical protein [Rhodospirillaceae bacterium]HAE03156.1 hypothetical protein [Rhodospirillaceae bacterium]HAJ21803.1 hypothetical protein [Rhodospirillaceae bacterium]|tara:strand:- start:496 stop:693 length:198 start_codon:yes stop_codon:yes gene_type:complete